MSRSPQQEAGDRREADAVDRGAHGGEDGPHLVAAQDDRELLLARGPGHLEHGPRATERLLVEELDAAEGDRVCPSRDVLDRAQVNEVLTDLFFRERVGGGMMEPRELGDCAGVGLDRAVGVSAQLQVLNHAVAERCHRILSERGERHHSTSLRHRPQSHHPRTADDTVVLSAAGGLSSTCR